MNKTLRRCVAAASVGLGLWFAAAPVGRAQDPGQPAETAPMPSRSPGADGTGEESPAAPPAEPGAFLGGTGGPGTYHPYQMALEQSCQEHPHLFWSRLGLGVNLGVGWIPPVCSPSIIGRAEWNNHFNIFNNQSAQPRNRVWYGFKLLDDYRVNATPLPILRRQLEAQFARLPTNVQRRLALERAQAILRLRDEVFHGIAGEVAMKDGTWSLTFAGNYIEGVRTRFGEDFWAGPFVMAKCLLYCQPGTLVSGVFGYEAVISVSPGEIRGNRDRGYPGFLFFHEYDNWVFQGGMQLGVPLGTNDPFTADGALSIGYWFYRDPYAEFGVRKLITGIMPQVELLGQKVLGDPTINDAYDIRNLQSRQPNTVFDFTIGLRLFLANLQTTFAWSVPIVGDEIKKDEFAIYFNYTF